MALQAIAQLTMTVFDSRPQMPTETRLCLDQRRVKRLYHPAFASLQEPADYSMLRFLQDR